MRRFNFLFPELNLKLHGFHYVKITYILFQRKRHSNVVFTGVEAAVRKCYKNMFPKFCNILSKTSVSESLFNNVAELQACFFIRHLQWLSLQMLYKKAVPKGFTNFTKTCRHRSPF